MTLGGGVGGGGTPHAKKGVIVIKGAMNKIFFFIQKQSDLFNTKESTFPLIK